MCEPEGADLDIILGRSVPEMGSPILIGSVFHDDDHWTLGCSQATARLIAAAPEMYDLIVNGTCRFQEGPVRCGNCERCKETEALIKKINA